eukprot:3181067-Rhodomonas_salina.6
MGDLRRFLDTGRSIFSSISGFFWSRHALCQHHARSFLSLGRAGGLREAYPQRQPEAIEVRKDGARVESLGVAELVSEPDIACCAESKTRHCICGSSCTEQEALRLVSACKAHAQQLSTSPRAGDTLANSLKSPSNLSSVGT